MTVLLEEEKIEKCGTHVLFRWGVSLYFHSVKPPDHLGLCHCLLDVNFLVCLVCYLFLCSSRSVSSNSQRPPPPTHTPLFVNTDYVCGLSQTLFVKLRILQQNIFGDKCCTGFVSSIFVYCYFEENNMLFFSFSFLVFANFMFVHLKTNVACDLNCK